MQPNIHSTKRANFNLPHFLGNFLSFPSVQPYTDQLLDTDAEECGDLYLDVAENYMHMKLHR